MSTAGRRRTLAQALDTLIRKRAALEGKEDLGVQTIADAIRARGGAISHTTIWKIRTGQELNPRKSVLEALASWGGVPPAYFFDDDKAEEVNKQLDQLLAMTRVRSLAARLGPVDELSHAGWQAAADAILQIRDREQHGRSST